MGYTGHSESSGGGADGEASREEDEGGEPCRNAYVGAEDSYGDVETEK